MAITFLFTIKHKHWHKHKKQMIQPENNTISTDEQANVASNVDSAKHQMITDTASAK